VSVKVLLCLRFSAGFGQAGELDIFRAKWLEHLLFVFDAVNVFKSLGGAGRSAFSFAPFSALSPNDIHAAAVSGPLLRWLLAWETRRPNRDLAAYWEALAADRCDFSLPAVPFACQRGGGGETEKEGGGVRECACVCV
jgi:hypothetical protein